MPPEPVTVWMVHARTGSAGHRGHLSLAPEGLRFVPRADGQPTTVVPYGDIKRVRRVWGSPVLELRLRTPNGLAVAVMGFYFTKPPNLEPPEDIHIMKRRRTKTRALNDLRRANLEKKETVAGLVREIRAARER